MADFHYDVIVVGGGIVGLTAALLLPEQLHIAVIDSVLAEEKNVSPMSYDLRVSAINLASEKIFEKVKAMPLMTQMRVSPFREIQVWEGKTQQQVHFSCYELGRPYLGNIIENFIIRKALLECIKTRSIDLIAPVRPTQLCVNDDHVKITLDNGHVYQSKLLLGADGANSWVREQCNIQLDSKPYQQKALVTTVYTEKSHQETAWQIFNEQDILAFLPLADPHYCSIVWSAASAKIDRLQQLPSDQFNMQLKETFQERLGELKRLDSSLSFSLVRRSARNYIKHRIALLGDAIHTIHPLAGQGLNLGLQDAVFLAAVIQKTFLKNRDIGAFDTLRRYERSRKTANRLLLDTMDILKYLFSTSSPAIALARDQGLRIINRQQFIKNFFIQQAIGNYLDA